MSNEGSQSLPRIIENELHEISTFNHLEKDFLRLSPDLSVNTPRKISLSESDLLTSLHRNLDNASDDDLLFLEWDKERNLFQDYINSLRKEIRVLLQERFESQQNTPAKVDEPAKIDLLQKSLEEKNFVFEQLQNEYELTKEKNANLTKKLSSSQSDTKSYLNTIDELKQKIADLTIDLQNQILVKRRLEMSIENLENNCQILDGERIRVTNELKENQHAKQDREKLVQKANVQIAEQGSTIEMLRSENVQVRSQLATMQRRMFQEKQQIMDYLRQIENDLIEKEQIKQRESSLRHDYEQLKVSFEKTQNDLLKSREHVELVTSQCSQLEEANQAWQSYQQTQLEHFRRKFQTLLPADSQLSLEQIAQFIYDYLLQLTQTHSHSDISSLLTPSEEGENPSLQSTPLLAHEHDSELRSLREKISALTMQCSQLNEANQAWQQFQYDQMGSFRNKLHDFVALEENASFDQAAQVIIDQYAQLDKANQTELIKTQLKDHVNFDENSSFNQMMEKIASEFANRSHRNDTDRIIPLQEEIRSLENRLNEHQSSIHSLKVQLQYTTTENEQLKTQVNQSNRLNSFRDKLQDFISFDNADANLDGIAEQIRDKLECANQLQTLRNKIQELFVNDVNTAIDQILQERENLDKAKELEIHHRNTIKLLNQELSELNKQKFANENVRMIDQQNQTDSFDDHLSDDERFNEYLDKISSFSSDELPNQLQKECKQILSKQNSNISSLPNIDLNQLALLTLRLLANQHLIDEAKQLYNETVIKALKEEYEMLNNDLNEQIDSQLNKHQADRIEELSRAKSWKETMDNESQTDDQQTERLLQMNSKLKRVLQTFKEKINRLVTERLDLFDGIGEETSERLDRLISMVENQTKQIDFDEHTSTVTKYELLLENEREHVMKNQRETDHLKEEIKQLLKNHQEQLKDLNDRNDILSAQLASQADLSRPTNEPELGKKMGSSKENECQTDDQQYEKAVQMMNKLKRALQAFKEKINRAVTQRPELFEGVGEETSERLDHLLAAVDNQSTQIKTLENSLEAMQYELDNERHIRVEQLSATASLTNDIVSSTENYEKQIAQLQQSLSQKDDERTLLREHLNEVQLELKKTSNDQAKQSESEINQLSQQIKRYESQLEDLQQELEKKTLPTVQKLENESQTDDRQYEKLVQMNSKLKRALQTIKEKINRLVTERSDLFDGIGEETNERLEHLISTIENQATQIDVQNAEYNQTNKQLQNDINELRSLLATKQDQIEQIQQSLSQKDEDHVQTIQQERVALKTQHQHEIEQVKDEYNQLREQLDELEASLKVQTEKNTTELQALVEQQSEELKHLQERSTGVSSQLQMQLEELKNQKEIETNDYKIQIENLMQELDKKTIPVVETMDAENQTDDEEKKELLETNNHLISTVENQAGEINALQAERAKLEEQLQQNLSEKDVERNALADRLRTVQTQLEKTKEDQSQYLQQQRDSLFEQHQYEIAQLKREYDQVRVELEELKKPVDSQQIGVQTEEDINQIEELQKRCADLVSQVNSLSKLEAELENIKNQREVEIHDFQNQIESLVQERTKLIEASEKKTVSLTQIVENETLETMKDKINRLMVEREDLFNDVGEDTNERVDYIVSLVENQATQIDILEAERDQIEKQLQNEIKQLQSSLEDSRQELEHERQAQTEQLSSPPIDNTSSRIEEYEKQIEQLQQNFIEKEKERDALIKRINDVELELRTRVDDHAALTTQYNTLVEQQRIDSIQNQRETEQMKDELAALRQKPVSEHVEIQTDDDTETLSTTLSRQSEDEFYECEAQIDDLEEEPITLLEEVDKKTATVVQTVDSEVQADDRQHRKLVQTNNKLKGIVQTFKDKLDRLATEKLDLFNGVDEDTSDRLDHLISTVGNQSAEVTSLQQRLSEKDTEHNSLNELLQVVQAKLHKADNDLTGQSLDYENQLRTVQQERDRSVEQQSRELELLQERYSDLSSLIDSQNKLQTEFQNLKNEKDAEIDDLKTQIDNLTEEIEKKTIPVVEKVDEETQVDDVEKRELVETHNKLQETLQTMKDKIDQFATEKPDLSNSIDTNISDRLDHLISTIKNQAEQIHSVEIDRNQLKEQLQNDTQQLQQRLSEKDTEQNSLNELLKEVQAKLEKANNDLSGKSLEYEDQLRSVQQERDLSIDQLRVELDELKKPVDSRQVEAQTEEDINALQELIEQQSEELQSLHKKCNDLSSEVDSQNKLQTELESQKTEKDAEIDDYKTQVENLIEEIEKKTIPVVETMDAENQTDDEEKKELLETNNQLISTVENQAGEINALQAERAKLEEQLQQNLSEKDVERNALADRLKDTQSELEKTKEDLSTKSVEYEEKIRNFQQARESILEEHNNQIEQFQKDNDQFREELNELKKPIDSQQVEVQTEEDINALQAFVEDLQEKCADLSAQIDSQGKLKAELEELNSKKETEIHAYKKQVEDLLAVPSVQTIDNESQTDDRQHRKLVQANNKLKNTLQTLKEKINRIATQRPTLFDGIDDDTNDQLDHLITTVENQTEKINTFQKALDLDQSVPTLQSQSDENASPDLEQIHPLTKTRTLPVAHIHTQTLGLSMFEDYQKQIAKLQENELTYQREIERLTQAADAHHQSSSKEGISRHMYEQEMLAWSKESEQLKSLVKQIQIENQKLKNLISKFEKMIHDYMHENERLKQENLCNASRNTTSVSTEEEDQDICYLLLKCLTYEVERREQMLNVDDSEEKTYYEKQFKTLRNQNERLKTQLESYTIHFKHVQQEMGLKIQEMTKLKDEIGRLQLSDIQYRLEIDGLKTELETDQSKIQELEHQLSNQKFKQTSQDSTSLNNLRELIQLKEREISALKEKLDYTKQTHQIELQEAQKANQFSLENVKRFEQMYLSHEEKRRELEERLKRFCRLTRPLMNNRQLFLENPIISLDELGKLINETDTEARITSTLSPIRDCLSLLEAQMKDLHHSIIENHARRSKRWKYKLGFECLSCESRWEVTHDIRDLQEACLDPSRFLESSIVEPMAGCSCPIMIDFVESDIRLCLDDMLSDVVTQLELN